MDQVKAYQIKKNIIEKKLTIYDFIEVGDTNYWLPSEELQFLLTEHLVGLDLKGLALRTRSKVVKSNVCEALGYPVPKSFKKTKPRFLCQNFDVYTQKSNNLQIWNEEISPARRYVLIRISDDDLITEIRVVTGDIISELDNTGKLTQKFQASYNRPRIAGSEQLSEKDTAHLLDIISEADVRLGTDNPASYPELGKVMAISILFNKLKGIVGKRIPYLGALQERNRGGFLHRMVCESLGYDSFKEDGKFPDVKHQLLEVKLQTSPTVDLGLFLPSDTSSLDLPRLKGKNIRMCDIRYAVFYGDVEDEEIIITNFYLVTGEDFFKYFRQFEGNKVNKKLQISLVNEFWEEYNT